MAAITIRQIPEETKQALRMRAAHNGRSMEAEAREILLGALEPPKADVSWLDAFLEFGERWGDEEIPIPPRDSPARYVDFSNWPDSVEVRSD